MKFKICRHCKKRFPAITSGGVMTTSGVCGERCRNAQWRDDHPGYDRRRLLRERHSITPEQFQAMVEAQNGKCKICGEGLILKKLTHIDHDHETGKIRALLCHNCNRGLGYFRDNPDLLITARNYLIKNKSDE